MNIRIKRVILSKKYQSACDRRAVIDNENKIKDTFCKLIFKDANKWCKILDKKKIFSKIYFLGRKKETL